MAELKDDVILGDIAQYVFDEIKFKYDANLQILDMFTTFLRYDPNICDANLYSDALLLAVDNLEGLKEDFSEFYGHVTSGKIVFEGGQDD